MKTPSPTVKKVKRVRAYADIGSHNGIFYFAAGRIAEDYPTLMHIYKKKLSKSLTPVIIEYTYEIPKKKKTK